MRVTEKDLDKEIVGEDYYRFSGTTVTVCCLKIRNGMCLVGESACVDPNNFDEAIGRKVSRANARDQLWKLLGFRLLDKKTELN